MLISVGVTAIPPEPERLRNESGNSGERSESASRSGSIRLDPRDRVPVRTARKRMNSPRWKESQAMEFPEPQRHWMDRAGAGRVVEFEAVNFGEDTGSGFEGESTAPYKQRK